MRKSYSLDEIKSLRGSVKIEYSLASQGAKKLRALLSSVSVNTFGFLTGNQAVQAVKAGVNTGYISGWMTAGDNNLSGNTYPDLSLYPANSVPALVSRVNRALLRADQIDVLENGFPSRDWLVPLVADAEAGFGGPLNAYELMRAMIESGAAGVHFEDQLSSAKKCGHLSGKVLVSTGQFIRTLIAARLAADVCDVPTVIVARTDAESAKLITSDVDSRDHKMIDANSSRTPEGYYRLCLTGLERAICRGLSYAPHADILWMETSTPDLDDAREFADKIHEKFPGKWLAYNCSSSFNWRKFHDKRGLEKFQNELASMGYVFNFITLCGWHLISHSAFDFSREYVKDGMEAYARLQDREHLAEKDGFTALKHQREVGTTYFDRVLETIDKESSLRAYDGSTEDDQFKSD